MDKKPIFIVLALLIIVGLYIIFKPSVGNVPITPIINQSKNNEPIVEPEPVVTAPIMPAMTSNEARFLGTVDSYSTGCYVDGECSITISGKKITTTLGWHQEVVGSVKGVQSFDDIKIGAKADVYAKKTDSGYTLYGNKDYYIDIK